MTEIISGPQTEQTINIIRGKNLVGHATKDDVWRLIAHIDSLESFLDEADGDDAFGTEGWRHRLGVHGDEE